MPIYYQDAREAIKFAGAIAPSCVGYAQGRGWFTYNPTDGCPEGCQPEFFIAKQGTLPLPMTPAAIEVWISALQAQNARRI